MFDIFMIWFGTLAAFQLVPAIYRIITRRSSQDVSVLHPIFGIVTQCLWLSYGLYREVPAMYISSSAWLVLFIWYTFAVIKFRSPGD